MRRAAIAAGLLAAASALCCATLVLRTERTGDSHYSFLLLNLALAWVPPAFAGVAYLARSRASLVLPLSVGWLLFFPNAPYILTDFIHLADDPHSSLLWYDALMVASFAWTGLVLGLASLYLMHLVARPVVGAWAWGGVLLTLLFGSLGVYLGRFVRINSWDALVRPRRVGHVLAHQLRDPTHHPRMVGTLCLLTLFLAVAYGLVYVTAESSSRDLAGPQRSL